VGTERDVFAGLLLEKEGKGKRKGENEHGRDGNREQ
jgi:hypothetical protein